MTHRAELSCLGPMDGTEVVIPDLREPIYWAEEIEASYADFAMHDDLQPIAEPSFQQREFWIKRHPNGVPYRHNGHIVLVERT